MQTSIKREAAGHPRHHTPGGPAGGKPRTAFVLAGGGSLGAIQVGMLRALAESGIEADLVIGSSVGAINAAYFAGDPSLDGITNLEKLWRGLRRTDIMPLCWRRLLGFLRRRDHLVPSDGLRRLLDLHLPYRQLQDAALPVHVVATDVLSGEAVVLSRGPATQAILASSAIPAAFAPVEVDGRLLCDGAVASSTPVGAAVARGARRLIVLPTGSTQGLQSAPVGAIASVLHAITLLTARQLAGELDQLGDSTECHILPTACPMDVSPFDFSRTSELIQGAYLSTMRWLEKGGLERRLISAARRPLRNSMPFVPRGHAPAAVRGSAYGLAAPRLVSGLQTLARAG